MKRKRSWFKRGCLVQMIVVSLFVLVGYMVLSCYIIPRRVLKHALEIDSLPSSIKGLRMGSMVWTDESRSFYFEIDPADFPLLLKGRKFELFDYGSSNEAKTAFMDPEVVISSRWTYMCDEWETRGDYCRIEVDEDKRRVVVSWGAD